METHKRALARNVLFIARLVSMVTKTTSVRVAILHSILKVKKKTTMQCDGKITRTVGRKKVNLAHKFKIRGPLVVPRVMYSSLPLTKSFTTLEKFTRSVAYHPECASFILRPPGGYSPTKLYRYVPPQRVKDL